MLNSTPIPDFLVYPKAKKDMIEILELMQECCFEHLHMGAARMRNKVKKQRKMKAEMGEYGKK